MRLIELLVQNPLLLLFSVAGLGHCLGKVSIFGVRFGVAAVLFVGLAISAIDSRLVLPDIMTFFGLVLFVYTTGLSCGPTFFLSLKKSGVSSNLLVLGTLILATLACRFLGHAFGLEKPFVAGMFSGALTNTPTLAAVLEQIKSSEPVVAYSLCYPMGVIGMILALMIAKPRDKKNFSKENLGNGSMDSHIVDRTIQIAGLESEGMTPAYFRQLPDFIDSALIFGRIKRLNQQGAVDEHLAFDDDVLKNGDLVSLIGSPEEVERACAKLGFFVEQDLVLDHSHYDYRRIFVSNQSLQAQKLSRLNLKKLFGARVTRVRRGDMDLIARDDFSLRLGDRVRVVAPRTAMGRLSDFFGDSYKAISEIDITTFSIGITAGLLLGLSQIPMPGGHFFRLGLAAGPLVVGLILGALGRTGSLCWDLPYSANLCLRQLGLILFLASVGTKSGYLFFTTLQRGEGLMILAAGSLLTMMAATVAISVGIKVLKIPYGNMGGILAGLQTQPAVLAFAKDITQDESPEVGYSTVFPMATLAKLILIQFILN